MAQLLKRAVDNTHPNSVKDKQGSYKAGDVVTIQDDSWVFSDTEGPPRFAVVSVAGTVEDWDHLLESPTASLKGKYPRSMMSHRRLRTVMGRSVAKDRLFTRRRKFKYTTLAVRKIQEEE